MRVNISEDGGKVVDVPEEEEEQQQESSDRRETKFVSRTSTKRKIGGNEDDKEDHNEVDEVDGIGGYFELVDKRMVGRLIKMLEMYGRVGSFYQRKRVCLNCGSKRVGIVRIGDEYDEVCEDGKEGKDVGDDNVNETIGEEFYEGSETNGCGDSGGDDTDNDGAGEDIEDEYDKLRQKFDISQEDSDVENGRVRDLVNREENSSWLESVRAKAVERNLRIERGEYSSSGSGEEESEEEGDLYGFGGYDQRDCITAEDIFT